MVSSLNKEIYKKLNDEFLPNMDMIKMSRDFSLVKKNYPEITMAIGSDFSKNEDLVHFSQMGWKDDKFNYITFKIEISHESKSAKVVYCDYKERKYIDPLSSYAKLAVPKSESLASTINQQQADKIFADWISKIYQQKYKKSWGDSERKFFN